MPIQSLDPLVVPPTQATPEAQWPNMADAFVTDQRRWTVEFNEQAIPALNQAVDEVESDRQAAQQAAATSAQDRAIVVARADEVRIAPTNAMPATINKCFIPTLPLKIRRIARRQHKNPALGWVQVEALGFKRPA